MSVLLMGCFKELKPIYARRMTKVLRPSFIQENRDYGKVWKTGA